MNTYQKKAPVKAIPFHEKEYALDSSKYPGVFDKAMLSELWWNKRAKDGRYHISNPHSHSYVLESTTVYEGDYIVTEGSGYVHVVPKEVFEQDYKIMIGSEGIE